MEKLFYLDPEIKEFTATVTGCAEVKNGWEVKLNATAFYPTGYTVTKIPVSMWVRN